MSGSDKQKTSAPVRLRPKRPCPLCGKPSQQKYHPFCSRRCADVDLHHWLGEAYAVPGRPPGTGDED